MLTEIRNKQFTNGGVYALMTEDNYPVEVTDTFLPFYTKNALGNNTNKLTSCEIGSRKERWMIGVSCMSGCPVRCKFCATGKLKKWRRLTAAEIVEQVKFITDKHPEINFGDAMEHKINYTRMGEPFLNIDAIKSAIEQIESIHPGTHHYVSTIGIQGADFSWVKGNITLQVSLHSLDESRRDELIPFPKKMSIKELGSIVTESDLKTTVNMTLVDTLDFNIQKLRESFDPAKFFIKLSPINENEISIANNMGSGIIKTQNLI